MSLVVDLASIGSGAPSGKAHPRTERDSEVLSAIPETAEPFPVLLEDALAREAVGTHDRVEAGLGGGGLPTPIVKGDTLIRDLSDQTIMEEDTGNPIVMHDAGVLQAPVPTFGDGGVHEAFDLAHVLRLVDVASIGPLSGDLRSGWPVGWLSHGPERMQSGGVEWPCP